MGGGGVKVQLYLPLFSIHRHTTIYVSSCLSCLRDGQVGWVGASAAEHCDQSMDYDSIAVGVVKAMFYKIAAAFDFSGNSDWVCCVLLTLFVS